MENACIGEGQAHAWSPSHSGAEAGGSQTPARPECSGGTDPVSKQNTEQAEVKHSVGGLA